MENRNCKKNSLAKVLLTYLDKIERVVQQHPVAKVQIKADQSPVTALDLALSELMEEMLLCHFPGTTFYSEEKFSDWSFPLLALDPLDGTREYVEGRPEWAVSLGLFDNENFEGEGWVFNPLKQECFNEASARPFVVKPSYLGEVSRSEWESGFFKPFTDLPKFKLQQMGSIAYKLGRLSQGEIDFVVSLRPKNIWDIAGGTILCKQAGLNFYAGGKLVTKVQKNYPAPLIWCHEELFLELSATFA